MAHSLPQVGDTVADKYVVQGLLGQGGMGAVYVVEHRVTAKRLALKCLLPEHVEHADRVERFLREAQAAGRIQHRHVVDVFDVGRDGDLLFIVMELLEGYPLSELIHHEHLTLDEMLVVLLRSMQGVAAAHAQGIIHRDLKPDNIFVCEGSSGRLEDPRVLDFGISKFEESRALELTQTGVMMGTPHYMAFEQINSQRDLDQRVDIYAMGVIAYEALSGRLPYVAESVGALAIQMMSAEPSLLHSLRPDLPDGLAQVVMRAMAKERDERYPTMQAFIDALLPYVPTEANVTASPLPPPQPASEGQVSGALALTPADLEGPGELRLAADEEEYPKAAAPSSSWVIPVALIGVGLAGALAWWSQSSSPQAAEPADAPDRGEAPEPARVAAPAQSEPPPAPKAAEPEPPKQQPEEPTEKAPTAPREVREPKAVAARRARPARAPTLEEMVPPAPPVPVEEVQPIPDPPAEPAPEQAPVEQVDAATAPAVDPDPIITDRLPEKAPTEPPPDNAPDAAPSPKTLEPVDAPAAE